MQRHRECCVRALVVFAIALSACNSGGNGDAGCAISDVADVMATDAGIDCGSYLVREIDLTPAADGGLARGAACALAAQDAGQAFALRLDLEGVDAVFGEVFVRTPAGLSFYLTQWQSQNACLVPGEVDESPCTDFSNAPLVPDGGSTALQCDGIGAATRQCGSSCN